MAVNLSKGQRVSLDKSVTMARIGLGWDVNRYDGGQDFDLDACVFLLGANGKVLKDEDFVFYNNLTARNGAVVHTGDNRTGDGDGDEVLRFDLVEEFSIETALVVCEIYRYNGDWKFNAVAAGYQGGLEALCRSYGVNV